MGDINAVKILALLMRELEQLLTKKDAMIDIDVRYAPLGKDQPYWIIKLQKVDEG